MTQALYRKWRSQTFDELVGQEHVVQTLRNALRDDRLAHAYLFSGPRGTGKTSLARILAKALNCSAPEGERPCNQCRTCVAITEGRMLDLIEIDAASNNSVDDVRDLRDKVNFRPSEGRYKVYVIDECHMLSVSAFNALLKTLEEPPPHARFVLATTEPHKIPATILSRCQRFDFRRISVPEIATHLQEIAQAEGFTAEEEALAAIARSAQGCMRDAISLLDQMLSYGHATVTFAQVQQALGAVSAQAVSDFVTALATRNVAAGLMLIQQLMTEGASLPEFCHQVVEHLRGVMVIQMTGEATLLNDLPRDTTQRMALQAKQMAPGLTLYAIKRFSAAIPELKGGHQPQLPLEIALIEAAQGEITSAPAAPARMEQVATPTTPVAQTVQTQPQPQPSQPEATGAKPEPPPQAPIPAEPVAKPPPLDAAAVQRLRSRWSDFLGKVRARSGIRVEAAMRSVRDIAISEQMVALAFGANSFTRDMVAQPETSVQVASVLSEFLGRPIKIECQVGEKAELANMLVVVSDQTQEGGVDPLLEYAVATLGAEVVE